MQVINDDDSIGINDLERSSQNIGKALCAAYRGR